MWIAHLFELEPGALDALTEVMNGDELNDRALEPFVLVLGRAPAPELARHGGKLADGDGRLRQHRVEARAGDGFLAALASGGFSFRHCNTELPPPKNARSRTRSR